MSALAEHAIAADLLFDGARLHENAAAVVAGENIARIISRSAIGDLPATVLPRGVWLAPGFVDLQVNGGGDLLFNDAPTPQTLSVMAAAHRKFGTTSFLPTLITDDPEKTAQAIAAVRAAMRSEPSVLGLHLEGPFISPHKAGVHDRRLIRTPISADIDLLTAPRTGALLVTLAPECVGEGFIERLVAADIRVSLGHTMATYAQARAAIAQGARGFTHLFNAMRPLESREPGPIAAALENPACWYGLIADGVHVAAAMLRLALRGSGNPILVSDAMPPVGGHDSTFRLYGNEITVADGRCVRADGTLAGALLDMASAVRNCVRLTGVPLEQAVGFATKNPASFLGTKVGRLARGYRADLIALDPERIAVLQTWVAGATRASHSGGVGAVRGHESGHAP
jgi:N-acetylglucosamine-6-phosphate deacetylase